MTINPFQIQTNKPLLAIKGKRNGYIQLSESREVLNYSDLSEIVLIAAKDWAKLLEQLGAKRVYWIIYSEQVKQIHIHLFPRWSEEEVKGPELFANRDSATMQPPWTKDTNESLGIWADKYKVQIIEQ